MSSRYGARHALPGYDRFRTGLTYDDVKRMMWDESEDRADWKYKRRGSVLGRWHQLKLEMYNQAIDAGMDPSRPNEPKDQGDGRCSTAPATKGRIPKPRVLPALRSVGSSQRPRPELASDAGGVPPRVRCQNCKPSRKPRSRVATAG